MLNIFQTNQFKKVVKKLHKNQKQELDKAVSTIAKDPSIGIQKRGDLSDIYVYKFKMNKQLTLLAYKYTTNNLTLMHLGSHENFYRDLKS